MWTKSKKNVCYCVIYCLFPLFYDKLWRSMYAAWFNGIFAGARLLVFVLSKKKSKIAPPRIVFIVLTFDVACNLHALVHLRVSSVFTLYPLHEFNYCVFLHKGCTFIQPSVYLNFMGTMYTWFKNEFAPVLRMLVSDLPHTFSWKIVLHVWLRDKRDTRYHNTM